MSLQNFGNPFCGGTILDESHILSAAHCELLENSFQINYGSNKRGNTDNLINIKSWKIHPQEIVF